MGHRFICHVPHERQLAEITYLKIFAPQLSSIVDGDEWGVLVANPNNKSSVDRLRCLGLVLCGIWPGVAGWFGAWASEHLGYHFIPITQVINIINKCYQVRALVETSTWTLRERLEDNTSRGKKVCVPFSLCVCLHSLKRGTGELCLKKFLSCSLVEK